MQPDNLLMKLKNIFFIILSAFAIIAIVLSCSWKEVSQKINGISVVAPIQPISQVHFEPIQNVHANWVAVIPYAFSLSNSPAVTFGHPRQWWGEKRAGTIQQIKYAHNLGLQVMLKPHVWVNGQGWTGDYLLENDEAWDKWAEDYSQYIMAYAHIADSMEVEMLCIGTEYRKSATIRPDIWRELIQQVRKVYHGKITYAANWDNYQNISFWGELDYIGIDAYFPMSATKSPSLKELHQKWLPTKDEIEHFSKQNQKTVIFTEFGYQSIEYASDGHWKHDQDTLNVDLKNQAVAYQALFDTFWQEPWFEGGFLWKWHTDHKNTGGPDNKRFTPQNKPAQQTIADWYGRH